MKILNEKGIVRLYGRPEDDMDKAVGRWSEVLLDPAKFDTNGNLRKDLGDGLDLHIDQKSVRFRMRESIGQRFPGKGRPLIFRTTSTNNLSAGGSTECRGVSNYCELVTEPRDDSRVHVYVDRKYMGTLMRTKVNVPEVIK